MPTDKEALQRLLAGGVEGHRLVFGINGVLTPFFIASEEGYRLNRAAELHARDVMAAITKATGRDVRQVVFIDRLYPARNKRRRTSFYPTEEPVDYGVREDHLDQDLGQVLHDRLGQTVEFCVGPEQLQSAGSALLSCLWPGLRRQLRFDGAVLDAAARNGLWVSLLYLLGFFLIGSESRLRRLLPLIKLLPRAIPVGTSAKEPDTWYVLVSGPIA